MIADRGAGVVVAAVGHVLAAAPWLYTGWAGGLLVIPCGGTVVTGLLAALIP